MTSVVPRKIQRLSSRIGWGEPGWRSVDKTLLVCNLASRRNGKLDIGVTAEHEKRVWGHKEGFVAGLSKDYAVRRLVWFEQHDSAEGAITREKQLKKWNRDWKIELIEDRNPYWNDLYEEISG
jgi:putative endonuclease